MNLQKSITLLAVAAALAIVTIPASAQQLYRGSFTLPFEAQFGSTTIEPGQYTLVVEQALGQKLVRVYSQSNEVTPGVAMLTASGDRVRESDIAKLKFENINGVATLKSFEDGFLGESYNFFIPGKAKNGERSSNRGADSSVAVLVATR